MGKKANGTVCMCVLYVVYVYFWGPRYLTINSDDFGIRVF